MIYLQVFLAGALFSFLGSIPPGTLNLSVLQLGLEKKIAIAFRFALAVSIVEYPQTWIAVQFEYWITSSPHIIQSFKLIASSVMVLMGGLNILIALKPIGLIQKINESGFRRGLVLSLLNPMAIPFWIGITAYLKSQEWINLSTLPLSHAYIFGTSVGVMILLTLFILLADKLARYTKESIWVKLAPGVTLLALGIYGLLRIALS